MAPIEKQPTSIKHEQVRQLLERATAEEICIAYLPDDRIRVDFAPHRDTPQAMEAWKQALSKAAGLWADRDDIEEERVTIRKEADR